MAPLKNHRAFFNLMSNFLFDLVASLALLTMLFIVCHLCNVAKPELALNGGYIFVLLIVTAAVFDAALTFLVFADAQSRYGKFSLTTEFIHRAVVYALSGAIALLIARLYRLRIQRLQQTPGDSVVIQTSAYTQSHLPM
jgi:branched-subunit amino acid ABC-type transport system permease component